MAKVTDIQDKNGVSKEIQDKDLARQTAATAIASTDYVMLQDTSGGYHKIAKASFTEAVRSALGSVINSTAKGTDIAKVPVLDSNNDLGMGTLANIASVLGAVCYKRQLPADYNIDNLTETGIYISNNGQDTYVVYRISDSLIYQTKYHVNEICQRVYWYGSGWGNWYRNDNYGTSSLSELASALGVVLGSDSYVSDINDVASNPRKLQTGAWNNNTTNLPEMSAFGSVKFGVSVYIPAFVGEYNFGIQIISLFDGSEIFFRILWGNDGFKSWRKLTITT